MQIREITAEELNPERFIDEKVKEISSVVGNALAINALSGGVDSSTVTMLGHRALGDRLRTYFIDNGLMREGEPQKVVSNFRKLGVPVILIDAQDVFYESLKGITDPEEKREAISGTFYKNVFGKIVKELGINFLLQGTNFTDVEETVAGIKRQHNVLEQLGIDTEERYGYKLIEPLLQLRKPQIRRIARALGLPGEICNRPPFPGPALAARIIGEVKPDRVRIVRKATKVVEEEMSSIKAFQCLAILHDERVTGVRQGKRDFGLQVEVRCWDSEDGKTATPIWLSHALLARLAERITAEVPEVVSVTYNIARKPPSTIEAI